MSELEKESIYLDSYQQSEDQYDPYELYERIPTKVLTLISLFSNDRNIPLVLADIPEFIFRNRIINPRTIPQLQ